MAENENRLVVISGPTASGKSEIAVELARKIGGEIISADSMQVYRHMDIGSAKITLEEMMGVPHYMIDVAEPTENFDVARFAEEEGADSLRRNRFLHSGSDTGYRFYGIRQR